MWPIDEPDGFRAWIHNLHDVYLNVQTANLALRAVPPSDMESTLESQGASRHQRLSRFVARDTWVLLEAWQWRKEFHTAFQYRTPHFTARLDELIQRGQSKGWMKHLRQIRDYMNHRDKKDYNDPGRRDLPAEAIQWVHEVRQAFSDLLLSAMGATPIRLNDSLVRTPEPDTAERITAERVSARAVATEAVDEYLTGSVMLLNSPDLDDAESRATAVGHFGRSLVGMSSASDLSWSESLTALIRRAAVAWHGIQSPELSRSLLTNFSGSDMAPVLIALVTTQDEAPPPTAADVSRLATHRIVDWSNGHGDRERSIAAALGVTSMLASLAHGSLEPPPTTVDFVAGLGREADALFSNE
ncbi:MAG: hypothetical protein JWM34_1299 [Ilumatobacteraceae bacterium]|nr:hypothetical protein [Ilumatobacteraceae bacterium]